MEFYTKTKMAIREFSFLTGISKDTLRFYDKIGLLSPELRGENGYRYYTELQLEMAFLIGDLRALGIGLEEIKRYANQRSPERMLTFFTEKDAYIEKEIERLRSTQELMRMRKNMVMEALDSQGDVVALEEKKREPIFLCPLPNAGNTDMDRLVASYDYAAKHGVNVAFPFGAIIPQSSIEQNDWKFPARYYFKVRKNHNAWKKEGTYAVLYRSLGMEPKEEFYMPLFSFVQENNLKMDGDVYEEYPMDQLTTREWEYYKARIEVRVTRQ